MIFVTVGTHHQPFGRLLQALSALRAAELVVQYGHNPQPALAARRAVPFMSFSEMLECFADARVVITHAGVGSILSALRAGHTPIVVPRQQRFGEHVDDHQVELTRALTGARKVIPVCDVSELVAAVESAPPKRAPEQAAVERPIHAALRAALHGQDA